MIRSITSASNFHRRVACPGSAAMEAGLPDVDSPDALAGTELHKLLANPSHSRAHLDDDSLTALEKVEDMLEEFEEWVTKGVYFLKQREIELPLFKGTPAAMMNHPDYLLSGPGVIAVADAKFGRKEVSPATDNWQIAIYLCAALEMVPTCERFVGAILQPWVSSKVKPVEMTRAEVQALRVQILEVLLECDNNPTKFNPSHEACFYCKGRQHGVCTAARDFALAPVEDHGYLDAALKNPSAFLATMEPNHRAKLLDALTMAEKLADTIRPFAKELLAKDPNAIPGYSITKPGQMRKVTDVTGLRERLEREGIPHEIVVASMSLPITAAESLVRLKTGLRGDKLKEAVSKIVENYVDVTPTAPKLMRE